MNSKEDLGSHLVEKVVSHLRSQRLCSRKEQKRETTGKKANLVVQRMYRGKAIDQSKITSNSALLKRLKNMSTWIQDLGEKK